jgi:hypothetical protein
MVRACHRTDDNLAEPAMEIAYLHVMFNHLPIMGVPIGLALLLLGLWTRSDSVKRAALLTLVVIGILTMPIFVAGKGGERFVEDAGLSDASIEAHEHMANIALGSTELLAALSLYFFLKHGGRRMLGRGGDRLGDGHAIPTGAVVAVLIVGIVTAAILGYTGRLGGKISHTEFYSGAAAAQVHEEPEADDDD